MGGVPVRLALSKRFLGIPPSSSPDRFDGWTQGDHLRVVALAFDIDFILNAAYPSRVLDKDSQPEMGVSYAIRSRNEVCKDNTAALTVQSSVPLLEIKRGVGIQDG